MNSRIRTIYLYVLNRGFILKFSEVYKLHQETPVGNIKTETSCQLITTSVYCRDSFSWVTDFSFTKIGLTSYKAKEPFLLYYLLVIKARENKVIHIFRWVDIFLYISSYFMRLKKNIVLLVGLRIHWLYLSARIVLCMTWKCNWLWSSNSGYLGNPEYSFISITPRSFIC